MASVRPVISLRPVMLMAVCLLACMAPAQAGSPDGRAWIGRMNDALARRNYDGVFVQQIGGRRETWRIIHRMRDGRMTERLISTDGSGKEYIRDGTEAVWYIPSRKAVVVEQRSRSSGYITALYGVSAETEKYYTLRSAERPVRIQGFTARLVTVEPRDELRYGYRYWIDEKNGMPVRTQLVAPGGAVVVDISFISMSLPDAVDDDLLKPDVDTAGFKWMRRELPAPPNSLKVAFVPREDLLPPGFRIKFNTPPPADAAPRTRFIISDGIAWVSVFIEKAEEPAGSPQRMTRSEGLMQMGSSAAYTLGVAGHRITVVGDVPPATVKAIASAVQPQ
jgi:sigma-E factor negative regulatory protein RseB